MKLYNSFLTSILFLSMVCGVFSLQLQAKSLAITNATVYTATNQGVLTAATVIINNGKIVRVLKNGTKAIATDETFNAQGKILTPGLIGSMNQLGLVEIDAVSSSRDAADKKANITFDPSFAFNPLSVGIPYTRKGGITRDVVSPNGGDSIFKGQSFVVDLSGRFDSVLQKDTAVVAVIGSKEKGSRAMSLQTLYRTLEDAADKNAKAKAKKLQRKHSKKIAKEKPEPVLKRKEKIINAILAGKKPLLVYADRASDILALIKLKKRFNLDLVILGAADGELVASQLVAAKVPVVIDAMRDLPGSFDSLHVSLSSAAKLVKAGVKIALTVQDTHNLYQLRFNAGNAIANGLPRSEALKAVTANVADIFHINAGKITIGKTADLVLWSSDPFELSSHVEKMWIAGKVYTTEARQDALRHRYLTKSKLPQGYTK